MSQLNANASEWQPSGNTPAFLTDFTLPAATAAPAFTPAFAPPSAAPTDRARGLSINSAAFTPQGSAAATPSQPATRSQAEPGAAAEAGDDILGTIDWGVEFSKVMELTERMINQQLNAAAAPGHRVGLASLVSGPVGAAPARGGPGGQAETAAAPTEDATSAAAPPAPSSPSLLTKTYASALLGPDGEARRAEKRTAAASVAPSAVSASERRFDSADGHSVPPLTTNGNRRWKKQTKAQQRREQTQRAAFEAFASALLHSVSPFMAPLRAKCKKALPHLKIDQRFGKSGQPQTAVAQFIAAPLVTNYRPRHFHDVSPGDLEEFMWELAHVLDVMPSAYSLVIGYGEVWKRYAVPYLYIVCKDYAKEVRALCPQETPNSRAEAVYEDDVVKDITEVVLAVKEVDFLEELSVYDAMKVRAKFLPLFDAFDQIFAPLGDYQVEITNLRDAPSRFLLKTSQLKVDQLPQPVVLYGSPDLWNELPVVSRVVVRTAKTAGSSGVTAPTTASAAARSSDDEDDEDDDDDEEDEEEPMKDGKTKGRVDGAKSSSARAAATAAAAATAGGGAPLWAVLAPVALSVVCIAGTVGIIAARRSR